MSTSGMIVRTVSHYRYTLAVTLAAVAAIFALPGTAPSSDPAYAPMALTVIVGLLLTVRVAPNRPASALVLLPAMAADARFGLAALPLVAYAAIVANLIRGMRGARVVSTAAHIVIVFAAARLGAQIVTAVPARVVFSGRVARGRL